MWRQLDYIIYYIRLTLYSALYSAPRIQWSNEKTCEKYCICIRISINKIFYNNFRRFRIICFHVSKMCSHWVYWPPIVWDYSMILNSLTKTTRRFRNIFSAIFTFLVRCSSYSTSVSCCHVRNTLFSLALLSVWWLFIELICDICLLYFAVKCIKGKS